MEKAKSVADLIVLFKKRYRLAKEGGQKTRGLWEKITKNLVEENLHLGITVTELRDRLNEIRAETKVQEKPSPTPTQKVQQESTLRKPATKRAERIRKDKLWRSQTRFF